MTEISKDDGVIVTLLERFEKFTLPRVLDIKEKVDAGELLDETDIDFLERVMENAGEIKPYVEDRPDLQALYTRVVSLYAELTDKALQNEQLP